MCGIVGYFGGTLPLAATELLWRMGAAVAHRGPDEQGIHVGEGAGLGHMRLAIIGVADGQQPMSTIDDRLWISFNGEIFNYVELRKDLEEKGCRFRTSSDTEVILHLYRRMGADCVRLLNGDFAFAIWDAAKRRMMLARDRAGVRPLFYTERDGTLFFASEVKALLQIPGIAAELDPVALDQVFTLWAPLAPRTMFKGVLELPPAHFMVIDAGGSRLQRYWDLAFPDRNEPPERRSEAETREELRALLEDAVAIRMRADVPVGAYLSGGLDSSVICALAAKHAPKGLRTFSVTFDTAEHDESGFQQDVVRALGTIHSSVPCGPQDIAGSFPATVAHAERPIVRTAPAPLHRLSRHVRDQNVKVVLTGEGADEIFAGYDIFKEARVRRFCARQPSSKLRPRLFRRLYPYLPGLGRQTPESLAAFFGIGADSDMDPLFSHRPRFRGTAAAKIFFSSDLRAALGGYDAAQDLADRLPADFARWHPLHQAQYIETKFLLPGYILSSQGDRMAMAHGVEGRFPFLDHRLIEFAARVRPEWKLRSLTEKHILRSATADLLPPAIGQRTKQPYRAPDSRSFFAGGEPAYVSKLLSPQAIGETGLFSPAGVEKLVAKCRRQETGFRDNVAFVGVLSTQLWHRIFAAPAAKGGTASLQPPFEKEQLYDRRR